ncbi:MAG: ferrous iron transport protein A [Peptococcaceae bacterium]|nr:ferrous iron transport protein A [Peptococcaceae bacterium]
MDLTRLPIGQTAVIQDLKCTGNIRRRLLDLGLVPGSLIKALRRSPIGDPTAYEIRDTIIALRREIGSQVIISKPDC